jgi:putative transposase
MARPLRIEYPGAWHYVMNQARKREKIFLNQKGYQVFLDLLGDCAKRFALKIHAYSLLPDRYELFVNTPQPNLSRAMRHLDGVYTQKVNRFCDTDGPLFRRRYRSILVDVSNYGVELIRYIHQSPLRAKLGKVAGAYPWASHRYYLHGRGRPEWLQREFVSDFFVKGNSDPIVDLDVFVNEAVNRELTRTLSKEKWPALLGEETFKEWVRETHLDERFNEKEIPQLRETLKGKQLGDLQELSHRLWGKSAIDWTSVRRGFDNPMKRALVYVGRTYFMWTRQEMGEVFGGVKPSAISKQCARAQEEIRNHAGCYRHVKQLTKALKCQSKT